MALGNDDPLTFFVVDIDAGIIVDFDNFGVESCGNLVTGEVLVAGDTTFFFDPAEVCSFRLEVIYKKHGLVSIHQI